MPPLHNKRVGSYHGHNKPWWHMRNIFYRMDGFAKEVPSFNIDGRTNVGTVCGGLVSFVVIVMTLIYASS